jgi:mono/diheme cytochrome c family protein
MRRPYIVCAIALLLLVAAYAPAQTTRPAPQRATAAPAQTEDLQLPSADVEHGRYLAERVAMCVECHSGRDSMLNILDSERYDGAPIPFVPPSGEWATRAPRNRGLPGYTNAMAMRLLTQGAIGRDGRQLRPPMPRFRMTQQDAADVIAYLRSLR